MTQIKLRKWQFWIAHMHAHVAIITICAYLCISARAGGNVTLSLFQDLPHATWPQHFTTCICTCDLFVGPGGRML